MSTIELHFEVDTEAQERLIAELADWDCQGFLQDDHALKAYIDADRWSPDMRERLLRWLQAHHFPAPTAREVADENWNAQWEASIRPVVAGSFLIKPTWAEVPPEHERKTVLEIDPKMSFGTGQHASTRLVLRLLPELVRPGDRVLDAGTGTGILAIAAVKQRAASVLAFDSDPRTQENAHENIRRNDVAEHVAIRRGTLADVPETGFDVVLANIHRAVLLEMLPSFSERLVAGGRVALAGLLRSDREAMVEAAASRGLRVVQEQTEADWWAVGLRGQ